MEDHSLQPHRCHCCPAGNASHSASLGRGLSRRGFIGGAAALGGLALAGLSWRDVIGASDDEPTTPQRQPLVVKPILLASSFTRREQTSWRPWGGIQTEEDIREELARIRGELAKLQGDADFPVQFLPVSHIRRSAEALSLDDVKAADTVLVYAASGDNLDSFEKVEKDVIIFCRYRSGPVYLWYEIVSPRFLRHHTDTLCAKGIDNRDVVIDSQEEILWRLRALCGMKNTMGTRIVALGGAAGWATPAAPKLAKERWKLDIQALSYEDLGKMIEAARKDSKAQELAKQRAAEYLAQDGIKLETDRGFVERAFLLEKIFRDVLAAAGARAFTINSCMGTIMGYSDTTACLPLSTLNDSGLMAYCESDFVVIAAGMLLTNISGKPSFLNDPTYPHRDIITLAHCTAPRRMDGKSCEAARILTHFESDYGASPKVEMRKGQYVTNILPDFKAERWVGLGAEIVDAPFFPICRSQIDVRFECSADLVADRMPGFHWMTVYGDYRKEVGYALRKTPIAWECL